MVTVMKIFNFSDYGYFRENILLVRIWLLWRKYSTFQYMAYVSPGRQAVLRSELSRCVQQDCTCDEGDAMVY